MCFTSSGDNDASYGSDEDGKRLGIVETYSPRKILQATLVTETRVAHSCTGKQDNSTVSQFLGVLKYIFNGNDYMVLGGKVRELYPWFQDVELLEVRKAWTFRVFLYPSSNEILSTMKGSGWTLEITDEPRIFSR